MDPGVVVYCVDRESGERWREGLGRSVDCCGRWIESI